MDPNLSFEIKIVFDNQRFDKDFKSGFGFSALIYSNFTKNLLLFDTGGSSRILIHNIHKFNIDVQKIKKVIISHNHLDHIGGLEGLYNLNPNIEIFVPQSIKNILEDAINSSNFHGVSELFEIEKNVYSSGQLGESRLKEQGLILKSKNNEAIIIVGCAHPGLENFINRAKKLGKVSAIIGGYHGFNRYSYLEGVKLLCPCHCTRNINEISKRFPEQYQKICVGSSLCF